MPSRSRRRQRLGLYSKSFHAPIAGAPQKTTDEMAAKSCGRNPQIVDQFLDGNLQRAAKPATQARRSFLGLQVVWFRFHPWLGPPTKHPGTIDEVGKKPVKTTFNGRTERGKYIKPFCPEKEERKRNDPNGRGWSPQLNTCGASVLRYPTI